MIPAERRRLVQQRGPPLEARPMKKASGCDLRQKEEIAREEEGLVRTPAAGRPLPDMTAPAQEWEGNRQPVSGRVTSSSCLRRSGPISKRLDALLNFDGQAEQLGMISDELADCLLRSPADTNDVLTGESGLIWEFTLGPCTKPPPKVGRGVAGARKCQDPKAGPLLVGRVIAARYNHNERSLTADCRRQ